jgi:hypothetical protein
MAMRAFAGDIIRDLLNADRSADCCRTLDIADDDRAVASIPFAEVAQD